MLRAAETRGWVNGHSLYHFLNCSECSENFIIKSWEEKCQSNYVSLKTQWLPITFKVKSNFLQWSTMPWIIWIFPYPQLLALTLPITQFFTSTLAPVSQIYQALKTYTCAVPLPGISLLSEGSIYSLHMNTTLPYPSIMQQSPPLGIFYDPYFHFSP